MSKTGWWKVNFEITLDGVAADISELPDFERQRIFNLIRYGCVAGEVCVGGRNEKLVH